jgi:hypothetical protein
MKVSNMYLIIPALLSALPALASNNLPTTGTLPDIIFVRKDCGTQTNCATTMKEATSWIAITRLPTAARPVKVDIGPGKFGIDGDGGVACTSYTSWNGAGPEQTILASGMSASSCTRFHVSSLKITGGFPAPVYWRGGGDSTWTNVHLDGSLYGWTETACDATTGRAKHQWFGSRISSKNKGYLTSCSENWFWGTELAVTGADNPRVVIALYQPSFGVSPEFHFYGSNLKLVLPDGAVTAEPSENGECTGAVVVCSNGPGASVHIHGTGIDIVGNTLPNKVVALAADNGGEIHANGATYNLSTGSGGTIQRVLKGVVGSGGHIHAPYMWETHPDAPFASPPGVTFKSKTGYDTAIVTSTLDGRPHMVIYDSTCTSGWWDTVTLNCR